MNIRQRILQYLENKNISKYKFYQKTGISNGFLDKEGSIGSDKCEIICYQYPDLSPEWLLTGNGPMLKGSDNKSISQSMIGNNSQMIGGKMIGGKMENNSNKNTDYQNLMNAIDELKKQIKAKDNMINNLMKQQDTLLNQISKLTDKLSN